MNKPLETNLVDRAPGVAAGPWVPSLERRRLRAFLIMLLADTVILLLSFATAGLIYENEWWQYRAVLGAELLAPLFFTICFYNNAYSARVLVDLRFAARKVTMALLVAAALLNFIAFYLKANAEFSRVVFTLGLAMSLLSLIAFRWLVIRAVRRLWQGRVRNELVLDDGGPPFTLETARVISTLEWGLRPDREDAKMIAELGRVLENQDKVIVTCPPERSADWAHVLKSAGVGGELVSKPAHDLGALGVHHYDEQDRTTVVVSTGPLGLRARITKRGFDLMVAAITLLFLSPILALVAIAIKLSDGGPVLFIQERTGRGNRPFRLLKFRSMQVNKQDASGGRSTTRDDERVTRIGRIIRSTSIDEFPQLLNVLRGDMSLVGSRPHALGSRAESKLFWEIDALYWRRHSLKPGVTGLAQVRGQRGNTEREQDLTARLQSDLEYIDGWSLRRDVEIMLQTLGVLVHERAY